MWCLGTWFRGEHGSAGLCLNSVILEVFFNLNRSETDLSQSSYKTTSPTRRTQTIQNYGIERLSPSHWVPAPRPLKLVRVASLSPAWLECGTDDRLASFASWGSYCSLSQQLGTVDLGQVHPRMSNRLGRVNKPECKWTPLPWLPGEQLCGSGSWLVTD